MGRVGTRVLAGGTGRGRHGWKMGAGPGALPACKLEFSALISQE